MCVPPTRRASRPKGHNGEVHTGCTYARCGGAATCVCARVDPRRAHNSGVLHFGRRREHTHTHHPCAAPQPSSAPPPHPAQQRSVGGVGGGMRAWPFRMGALSNQIFSQHPTLFFCFASRRNNATACPHAHSTTFWESCEHVWQQTHTQLCLNEFGLLRNQVTPIYRSQGARNRDTSTARGDRVRPPAR